MSTLTRRRIATLEETYIYTLVTLREGSIRRISGRGKVSTPFPDVFTQIVSTDNLSGGIITSYSSSFENLDGHGHGTKLEATCMVVSHDSFGV